MLLWKTHCAMKASFELGVYQCKFFCTSCRYPAATRSWSPLIPRHSPWVKNDFYTTSLHVFSTLSFTVSLSRETFILKIWLRKFLPVIYRPADNIHPLHLSVAILGKDVSNIRPTFTRFVRKTHETYVSALYPDISERSLETLQFCFAAQDLPAWGLENEKEFCT